MQKFLFIIAAIFVFVASAPAAQAQSTGIEDIIRDIFEGTAPPQQTPIYGEGAFLTLPVSVTFEANNDASQTTLSLPDHSLTLTATPPDPSGNSRRSKLRPVSSVTIALDDILGAAQIPLALPAKWADRHAYLMIDAQIRDSNQGLVYQAEQVAVYRGHTPPALTLVKASLPETAPARPDYSSFEFVKGEVEFLKPKTSGAKNISRGSILTVQLLENALAGGTSMMVAAEKQIPLDGISAGNIASPVPFELQRGIPTGDTPQNLTFKAWVTDWAGRKTHIMRSAVAYQGPDIDYSIQLDRLAQGKDTKRGRNLDPTLMAQTLVSGEAVFDPVKGIPGNARLKVQLTRSVGAYGDNPILAEQTLLLRGMETRIPFSITTDSTNFDPLIPAPYLSIALTDSYGRTYYASGDIRAQESQNTVRLFPR